MKKQSILIAGGAAALSLVLIALPSPSQTSSYAAADPKEAAPAPPAPPQEPPAPEMGHVVVSLNADSNSWLGVETQEVTSNTVRDLKLPAERGVVIGKVMPDSPAAKTGLKENDVVTQLNGETVQGAVQFRRMIHEIPAGRKVQLTIWRDGRSQTIDATLGKAEEGRNAWFQAAPRAFTFRMPETPEIPEIPRMEWDGNMMLLGRPRLGIEAEDLNDQLGTYFGAPEGEGILVRSVNADSPALKAGIKAGDVITSLNGEKIHSVQELREKLAAAKDAASVKIGLLRNKNATSLTVEIPSSKPATARLRTRAATI